MRSTRFILIMAMLAFAGLFASVTDSAEAEINIAAMESVDFVVIADVITTSTAETDLCLYGEIVEDYQNSNIEPILVSGFLVASRCSEYDIVSTVEDRDAFKYGNVADTYNRNKVIVSALLGSGIAYRV